MHAPASILPLKVADATYCVRGKALVEELSFTLGHGRRTVILGPNGSGKTLTLHLCHGLIAPTSGKVEWLGAASGIDRKRHALVFQHPVMLRRSMRANLLHALSVNGWGWGQRRERAELALERFGLRALADRAARVASGGERQRLALARAWALHPEVLFLDEPTASLDPGATREIESIIRAFDAAGTKIVMSTHSLGQARRLGDEVIYLHQGRVAERAPIERFFPLPSTAEAAAFVKGELPWA